MNSEVVWGRHSTTAERVFLPSLENLLYLLSANPALAVVYSGFMLWLHHPPFRFEPLLNPSPRQCACRASRKAYQLRGELRADYAAVRFGKAAGLLTISKNIAETAKRGSVDNTDCETREMRRADGYCAESGVYTTMKDHGRI